MGDVWTAEKHVPDRTTLGSVAGVESRPRDMKQLQVVVLSKESETVTAVRAAVESNALGTLAGVCKDLTALRAELTPLIAAERSAVVLVDVDSPSEQFLQELSKVTSAYPSVRFLAVALEFNEELVLQAMQSGARHFLRKGTIASELGIAIKRLLAYEMETPVTPGVVISVFSCSGGCGATTVAVNLANELRMLTAKQVLIVDLDNYYGAVASYLNLKGDYGIAHVLGRGDEVDRHVIDTSIVPCAEGIDVLLSPAVAAADRPEEFRCENIAKAMEVCKESRDYVVVDAPRLPDDTLADLALLSRAVLLVFQPTVKDVRFVRAAMAFLTDVGVAPERVIPVANRVKKRGAFLKLDDSHRAVGSEAVFRIRNNWRKAVKCINYGQPIARVAGRSNLRRDLRELARKVHGIASS
ncbi:MAG: AAA family ATPase [Planctomycetota bacterium]